MRLPKEHLAQLNAEFEHAPATDIIRWTVDSFHPRLILAVSMSDAVLIDLCVSVEPSIEAVFIDTGYHFKETLDMVELVRSRYDLNLRVMRPELPPEPLWKSDPLNCCSSVKVSQLDQALEGKDAWMSGLRRTDSPERADAPIVSSVARGRIKVNPVARWSEFDVRRYIDKHDVPVNPLLNAGYRSIGCWPCTRAVGHDESPRAGRWPDSPKTECGLHG